MTKIVTQEPPPPQPDIPIVPPPSSFTVSHEHKPVLFTADGKALVRRCGF